MYKNKKVVTTNDLVMFMSAILFLLCEVVIVREQVLPHADCSMYLLLPIVTYYLLRIASHIRIEIFIPKVTTGIYMMQYGIITAFGKLFESLGVNASYGAWIIYVLVLIIPCITYRIIKNTRIEEILF